MSGFFRELHVPGLVVAIVLVVWCTAQMANEQESHTYYPPDNPALYRYLMLQAAQAPPDAPEPLLAGVEVEP